MNNIAQKQTSLHCFYMCFKSFHSSTVDLFVYLGSKHCEEKTFFTYVVQIFVYIWQQYLRYKCVLLRCKSVLFEITNPSNSISMMIYIYSLHRNINSNLMKILVVNNITQKQTSLHFPTLCCIFIIRDQMYPMVIMHLKGLSLSLKRIWKEFCSGFRSRQAGVSFIQTILCI